MGNLSKIIYPDNTAVTYAYDANHNLIRVTDWANRVTSYTYDVNNRVVGVTKPDGSVTTTVYDNKQRVTSTVERTATGAVITGFEYTYDDLSRIIEEKVLANSTKMCYTYDNLSRVTARTVKKLSDNSVVSTENFNYDAAGNVTSAPDSSFQYDTNNRLISWGGNTVSYDLDGNMLSNGSLSCTYDSANRLVSAGGHTHTYNAEDVRIRNLCAEKDTTYTYNTNAKLSMLLMKTTNGVVTKYVYGKGLIGEEVSGAFKTYHFDCRGSTIAITDTSGNITDTFAYDTYGKLLTRTGTSKVIFGYNGRDGVVTDDNGLIYMRARYYSPEMKRFINADVVAGAISNAITLNRFAFANGNPVSFVDPFGLWSLKGAWNSFTNWVDEKIVDPVVETYHEAKDAVVDTYNTAENAVVDTYNNAKDFVVDTYNDAKQTVVNAYQEVKDWTVDTYNEVKDRVVTTTANVVSWVDNNVVKPVTKAATAVGDWFEEAGEWLNENARNKDGSYALYDNQRFNKDAVFHEQILAFTPSGPSFNLKEGNIGLGSLAVDGITGGWEGEHANLSLLDFCHAEVSAEMKNGQVSVGALASIWSPSFSVTFFGVTIELGAEVGAIGAGIDIGKKGFKAKGAYAFGASLSVSW